MTDSEGSTVRRLHVEPVEERKPGKIEYVKDAEAPPKPYPHSLTYETALAVIQAGAFALSARALLLIALLGAFALAWQAMSSQTITSLAVLAIYGLLTILPISYLETRRGRSQQ